MFQKLHLGPMYRHVRNFKFCIRTKNVKSGFALLTYGTDDYKKATHCHLGSSKIQNFHDQYGKENHSESSCQISWRSVKQLPRYDNLSIFLQNVGHPPSLIHLTHSGTNYLHRYAKFGWNRHSRFDNVKVLIFCAFGLKTPIRAPKIGVLGI